MRLSKLFGKFNVTTLLSLILVFNYCKEGAAVNSEEMFTSSSARIITQSSTDVNANYLQHQLDMINGISLTLKGVLVFESNTPLSIGIKLATLSRYSHTAFLLVDQKEPWKEYCFESTQSYDSRFPGIIAQVQIRPLETVLDGYAGHVWERDFMSIDGKPLNPDITHLVKQYLGKPFRTNVMEICKLFARRNTATDNEHFFCIELLATVLQNLGYLPSEPLASNYIPCDFSQKYENLKLLKAKFGPEVEITIPHSSLLGHLPTKPLSSKNICAIL